MSELTAREISEAIRNGQVSAEKVMRQMLEAASRAHLRTNCIVQIMDSLAIQEAKQIDRRIASGETFDANKYPLLGVPISVKDMINVKGADTVAGASENVGKPKSYDAAVVGLIRSAGAIPFCKTNVPQFVWTAESSNPVIGATCNPANREMASGGSSGGEGALIASGGSILGIGSDIGGSLRFPAHFCGIYSLKPTHGRLPVQGHVEYFGGQESIPAVVGPMANSVDNLKLFMEACLNQQPWLDDWKLDPVPFRKVSLSNKLKIGFYTDDGVFPASPACHRAVMNCIAVLESNGHECVPFHPPRANFALNTFMHIANADAMASCRKFLSKKDSLEKNARRYLRMFKLPNCVKKVTAFCYDKLGQPNSANLLRTFVSKSVKEVWQLTEAMRAYQLEFQLAWQQANLDFVICPTSGLPAHPHNKNPIATPSFGYAMLYSFLNYPAGVIPVTHVNPELDGDWLDSNPRCRLQRDAAKLYNPQKMAGQLE